MIFFFPFYIAHFQLIYSRVVESALVRLRLCGRGSSRILWESQFHIATLLHTQLNSLLHIFYIIATASHNEAFQNLCHFPDHLVSNPNGKLTFYNHKFNFIQIILRGHQEQKESKSLSKHFYSTVEHHNAHLIIFHGPHFWHFVCCFSCQILRPSFETWSLLGIILRTRVWYFIYFVY